jgi:hypothetical protein
MGERKNQFEVLYAYLHATNDDGVGGIYTFPFSYFVDEAAAPMALLDYPHGNMPFAWHVSEYTTGRLLDARGVSELVMTDQNFLKHLRDLTSDHAQLFSLPPFLTDSGITERDLSWRSLGLIRTRRNEKLGPVPIPDLPAANIRAQERIEEMVSAYFGVPLTEINAMLQQVLTGDLIDNALDSIGQAVRQVTQLLLAYMPMEDIVRITGDETLDEDSLRDSVLNLPDFAIEFTPEAFNLEFIKAEGEIIRDILLAIDPEETVIRSEAVAHIARRLSISFAKRILRPVEDANTAEVNDEEMNFLKIKAGLEPAMKEQGQNYALRLQTLERILTDNPESAAELQPVSQQILEQRLKHLSGMAEQGQNAQIGRVMGAKVL